MLSKIIDETLDYFESHPTILNYFKIAGIILLLLLLFNASTQFGEVAGKILYHFTN